MCYIKMFIANKKKKEKEKGFDDLIKSIFKNDLDSIFDNPEYIKLYFQEFLTYSENKYKTLVSENVNLEAFLYKHTEELANINKISNTYLYYKELFFQEYLSAKFEE